MKKYDLTQVLKDQNDEAIELATQVDDEGKATAKKVLTLGLAIETAILTPLKTDTNLTPAAKADLFKLWLEKIAGKKETTFTEQELETIKQRAGAIFPIISYGRIHTMLSK